MIRRTTLPEALESYVAALHPETPLQARLRKETEKLPNAGMQIGPDQGAFLALLARLLGARRCLEIGTFTGYSALRVAEALPPEGRMTCLDVSDEWTRIGRPFWEEAGVASQIDLLLAPALETLPNLAPGYDLAFIDADKPNTPAYYEHCLRLVRIGGLIAIDNALSDGRVANPEDQDEVIRMWREFSAFVCDDPRVEHTLVTIGDGLLLARRLA